MFFLLVFPQCYRVLGAIKSQIVCRGAKIIFGRLSVSKKGFSNKNALFVFVFMLEKTKEKK